MLLAGAVRHKKIVFVGKEANMERRFQGWSYADDLLPQLVTAHPQYATSLVAWAAARHWELVEPQDAPDPAAVMAPVPVVNQIRRMVETSLEAVALCGASLLSDAFAPVPSPSERGFLNSSPQAEPSVQISRTGLPR